MSTNLAPNAVDDLLVSICNVVDDRTNQMLAKMIDIERRIAKLEIERGITAPSERLRYPRSSSNACVAWRARPTEGSDWDTKKPWRPNETIVRAALAKAFQRRSPESRGEDSATNYINAATIKPCLPTPRVEKTDGKTRVYMNDKKVRGIRVSLNVSDQELLVMFDGEWTVRIGVNVWPYTSNETLISALIAAIASVVMQD
ncbi:MAG: hypothetical protein KGL39_10350 [Patescibacteria group bacterium]|nr:hypothetical protein [Patescibacteria group bacterium]